MSSWRGTGIPHSSSSPLLKKGNLLLGHPDQEEEDEEELIFDHTSLLNRRRMVLKSDRSQFFSRILDCLKCFCPSITGTHLQVARTCNLCLSFFALGLCFAIPTATLDDLRRAVDAGQEVKNIYTARYSGYLFGAIFGGFLFDRYNRQFLLFLSLLATGVGILVMPFCKALAGLMACTAITGITMGFLDTGGNVWCLDLWGRRSGPVMQGMHFCFGLGAFLAPLVAEPFLTPPTTLSSEPAPQLGVGGHNIVQLSGRNSSGLLHIPPVGLPHHSLGVPHLNHIQSNEYNNDKVAFRRIPRSSEQLNLSESVGTNATGDTLELVLITSSSLPLNDSSAERETSTTLTEVEGRESSETESGFENITNSTGSSASEMSSNEVVVKKKPLYADGNQIREKDQWENWKPKKDHNGNIITQAPPVNVTLTPTVSLNVTASTMITTSNNISTSTEEGSFANRNYSEASVEFNGDLGNFTDPAMLFENVTEIENGNSSLSYGNASLIVSNNLHENDTVDNHHYGRSSTPHFDNSTDSRFMTNTSGNSSPPNVSVTSSESTTTTIRPVTVGTTTTTITAITTTTTTAAVTEIPTNVTSNIANTVTESTYASNINISSSVATVTVVYSNSTLSTEYANNIQKKFNMTPKTLNSLEILGHTRKPNSPGTAQQKLNLKHEIHKTASGPTDQIMPTVEFSSGEQVLIKVTSNEEGSASVYDLNTDETKIHMYAESEKPILKIEQPLGHTEGILDSSLTISNSNKPNFEEINGQHLEERNESGISQTESSPNENTSEEPVGKSASHIKKKPLDFLGRIFEMMNKNKLGRFEIPYVILSVYIFIVALIFLAFLCHNPRELRSKQDEELDHSWQPNSSFRVPLIALMALFFCLYVGMEVAVGQLLETFATKEDLQLSRARGYFLPHLFWGSFAVARGLSICVALQFSGRCMLLTNLSICLVASVMLVAGADKLEALLWIGIVLLGLGMAPLFPTAISWVEGYIRITNKMASLFILGAAVGEIALPTVISVFINQEPMVLMYVNILVNCLSFACFLVLCIMASRQSTKYTQKSNHVLYHLANSDDAEEIGTELTAKSVEFSNGVLPVRRKNIQDRLT